MSGPNGSGAERELLLEVTTRLLLPTILVFSLYLLFAGHYGPGGGFSGGLVAGLAFVLLHIACGHAEVRAAVPVRPPVIVGAGLAVVLVTAATPILVGEPVLSSAKWSAELPLLGTVELQTSLFLDLGVYVLLVGVVLDLLRSLGAGIERDLLEAAEPEAGEDRR